MGLREDKKFELRRQILTTAMNLFGERGLGATRVADIARVLRISEATFFNYFPTKQAVCEEAVADVITQAIDDALDAGGPIHDQLDQLAVNLSLAFTADRALVPLVCRHPEIMAAGWMRLPRPHPALTERIQSAQTAGKARDDLPATVLADVLLDTVLTALTRRLARTGHVPTPEDLPADPASDPAGEASTAARSDLMSALQEVLAVWVDGSAPRATTRRRTVRRSTNRPKPTASSGARP